MAGILVILFAGGCARSPEERWSAAMDRGKALTAKKDYARAALEFDNAIQAIPSRAEAYYQRALASLSMADAIRAIAMLRKATSLDPSHAGAQLKLSQLMTLSQDENILAEAQEKLLKLLDASPGDVSVLTALAMAEWKLGKTDDAEKRLEEALRRMPHDLDSAVTMARLRMQEKDFGGAERVLRIAADRSPVVAETLIALGEFYLMRNRWAEAAEQFRRALESAPQNVQALRDLASAEMAAGRWERAEEIYQRISLLPDPKFRTAHAAFLLRSGKLDQALAEFSALAKNANADRATRSGLVTALVANNQTQQAEAVLQKALRENPKDADALIQRSGLLLARRQFDQAERDLNQALQAKGNSETVRYLLSKVFASRGEVRRQRQELDEVLRLNPGFLQARVDLAALLIQTKAVQAAIDLLKEAPKWQQSDPAWVAQQNWANLAIGKRDEVRKGLESVEATAPLSADFLVQKALFRLEDKQFSEVRRLVGQVLSQHPGDRRALELLVLSYRAEKQLPQAVTELRRLSTEHPQSAVLQLYLGGVLTMIGKPTEAREAYQLARHLDPALAEAYLLQAELDIKSGKKESARQLLNSLLAQAPKNVRAILWLGNLSELEGNHPAAIESYRQVLQIDSSNVQALNNLAFLLAEYEGKADEALTYAQKAKELDPVDPAISNTLGWVYFQKGLYGLAATHLEESVSRGATAQRRYHLAMAYSKAGRHLEAQQTYSSAKQMDPAAPEALTAERILGESSNRSTP